MNALAAGCALLGATCKSMVLQRDGSGDMGRAALGDGLGAAATRWAVVDAVTRNAGVTLRRRYAALHQVLVGEFFNSEKLTISIWKMRAQLWSELCKKGFFLKLRKSHLAGVCKFFAMRAGGASGVCGKGIMSKRFFRMCAGCCGNSTMSKFDNVAQGQTDVSFCTFHASIYIGG